MSPHGKEGASTAYHQGAATCSLLRKPGETRACIAQHEGEVSVEVQAVGVWNGIAIGGRSGAPGMHGDCTCFNFQACDVDPCGVQLAKSNRASPAIRRLDRQRPNRCNVPRPQVGDCRLNVVAVLLRIPLASDVVE